MKTRNVYCKLVDNSVLGVEVMTRICNEHLNGISIHIYILSPAVRILVQVTLYRELLIGQDGHLDQSEAYDVS